MKYLSSLLQRILCKYNTGDKHGNQFQTVLVKKSKNLNETRPFSAMKIRQRIRRRGKKTKNPSSCFGTNRFDAGEVFVIIPVTRR